MRKPIQKIISLMLCIGMLISISQFSFVFANESTENYNDAKAAKEFLNAIGASVNNDAVMSAPATRGDFLTALMSLMNLISPYGPETKFADIAQGTLLANATNFAVATGIISPADKFYPEAQVTYSQAAKMTIEALGSGKKAIALGGYPYGYIRLASENELDEGLSGNEAMTTADMYIMLANLCEANVYSFSSFEYSEGVTSYNLKEGKPFMEAYMDICKAEGIVDAANGSYLYDNTADFDTGCISVNDVTYSLADGVECSLGLNVEVFYRNEGKATREAVYIRPAENKIKIISHKNSPELSGGKLTYYDDSDKEAKLSVDSLAAILYNGRADGSISDSDFAIDSGYIEAIDNDGDNVYEVLSIWEPDYLEIGAVNVYNNIIYDAHYKTNINLDDSDITFRCDKEIEYYNAGDVLEVFVSNDGKYVKVNTINNTVSGVVSGYGTNGEVYVNDVKYETHPYFDEFYRKNIELSKTMSFVVNADGLIVAAKLSDLSEFKYAYFDAIKKKDGLSPEVLIKLYTEDDEVLETKLSEKIKINGSAKTDAEAHDMISNQIGSIIRYQANGEGKISAINTVLDEEGIYEPFSDGFDTLKRYRFPNDESETLIYYKTSGYFVPHFTINTSTAIFCVSPDTTLDDEERFSMAKTLTFLDNDERVPANSLKAYNVSDTGCADALLYSAKVDTDVNIDYAPFGIIAECTEALDNDGDEAFKIVMYVNDSYITKYIDKEAHFVKDMNLAEGEVPFHMGDVIRYTESAGRITNAAKDFDGETMTLLNTEGDNKMVHYYYGKIYAFGASSVAILKDDGSIAYVPYSIKNVCMVDENDVYTAPKDVIATYKQAGDKATKILVKCRYSAVAQVYTFK